MKKLIIIALLQAMLAGIAYADYHYASHEGTSEYPYDSWATAADSIQKAVDAASPHDTVYIGAGEWTDNVLCEFYDSVAIIGMGWDNTYWYTDEYRTPAIFLGDGCLVDNIKFKHPDWRPVEYMSGGPSAIIHNCKFINCHWGVSVNGGNSEVTDCVFDSCEKAIDVLDFSGTFLISNNLILNTWGDWALFVYSSSSIIQNNIIIPGGSINAIEAPNSIIRNNVIIGGHSGIVSGYSSKYNNTTAFQSIKGMNAGINDSLVNNILMDCNEGVVIYDSNTTISYNNFWNNEINIETNGVEFDSVENRFNNPMFVSDTDVHLQAYSPLIDAGAPWILDVDGTRSDIGAYGGSYGESYEYRDLAPTIPDSFSASFPSDTIFIDWRYNTEADFNHYQLHRDTLSGFEPSVFNQIAEPETSFYADLDVDREHHYYYLIAAIDNQDNISAFSSELEVIPTGIWDQPGATLPQLTGIKTNYPNPFNTSTTLIYTVADLGPIPAEIEIDIYDIVGRKVRTLINERREIGEHSIIWDGRDDSGGECSTGVYFAKISQWGLEVSGKPRKLVLVK